MAASSAQADRLAALAEELGLDSVYELALRFALAKPGISCVLVGFSSMEQLEQAITWAGRGALPTDSVQRVLDLATVEDSATMPRSGVHARRPNRGGVGRYESATHCEGRGGH